MDEEVSLDLQQVLDEELADKDPAVISELTSEDDQLFLYGPEVQEPFQVDGSIAKYAIFYSLNGDSLQAGFSEFDQETETPVLGSSDFKRNIEGYIVDGAEITETSILLDAGEHTFEATPVTPVSENKVEDQNGNIYTVYEGTIDELLEGYQDQD